VSPSTRSILAADPESVDHLGYNPSSMVGQPFGKLGPDIAALDG
jgi:hypothetical protein